MPRLSLNMDEELHQRLLIYAIKTTGKAHGVKEQIILDAIKSYLDTNESAAPAVECVVSSGEVPVTAKPVKKTTRKTETRRKRALTDTDREYMKEQWKTGKGWTEIGKGLNPVRRPTVVKAAIESMIKKGELSETDRKI